MRVQLGRLAVDGSAQLHGRRLRIAIEQAFSGILHQAETRWRIARRNSDFQQIGVSSGYTVSNHFRETSKTRHMASQNS
jgi:hypothetical protein